MNSEWTHIPSPMGPTPHVRGAWAEEGHGRALEVQGKARTPQAVPKGGAEHNLLLPSMGLYLPSTQVCALLLLLRPS